MNNLEFALEMKNKRLASGLSQGELASLTHVSRYSINRFENGKANASKETQNIILRCLNYYVCDKPFYLLVDYLSVRFPTTDALEVIRKVLGMKADYFIHYDYGYYGYKEHYAYGEIKVMASDDEHMGVFLELKGAGSRNMEYVLQAQNRDWYSFLNRCLDCGGVIRRFDLAINDKAGILDIPKLKEKYKAGECISYFRMQKDYSGTEKCGSDLPKNTGETLYLGSTSSELYMCAYQKNYEQYVKNGTEIEDMEIKNRFEIRMKNERAYYAVVDLLTYRDAERTAFSIINHYVRFVDREDDKPKSQWKTNDDWAWFIGENREPIRLTTKPEPYTLQKALHWLQRQVAPTIKMVQALDRENHTTILKDMIEQAELKDKHKHLLQLEKSTIEERIDTAVPQENDGIF